MNLSSVSTPAPEQVGGQQLVPMDPNEPNLLGREGTFDQLIFNEIFHWDEYVLTPRRFSLEDRVLDIGAHAGFFTHCMLRRGVQHIHLYEVQPENLRLCRYNLQGAPETVQLFEEGVWGEGGQQFSVSSEAPLFDGEKNTGGFSLLDEGDCPVTTVSFDQAIERLTEGFTHRVRLVKLDAEGAEWPILFQSKTLKWVDEIVGEFHEIGGAYDDEDPKRLGLDRAYTRKELRRRLREEGFQVRCERRKSRYGIFFATRDRSLRSRWRGYGV